MEKLIKIIIHGVSSVIASILLGLLGLIIGAVIGGNYPVPDMFGLVGYEAAGALGGLLGISLGTLLATLVFGKTWKQEGNIIASCGLLLLGTILNFLIHTYSTFPYTLIVLIMVPTAAGVIGFWWKS